MFENLTTRLGTFLNRLQGTSRITERNIQEVLREIRLILLEADVNYQVAKQFVERVKGRALGTEVVKSVKASQQMTKIIYDEMAALLGGGEADLLLDRNRLNVIMLVGVQGSGKTSAAAKLGRYLKKHDWRPLLVAADLSRPAAIDQLEKNGGSVGVPVFSDRQIPDVSGVCQQALAFGRERNHGVVVVDTAGRMQVDQDMMEELVTLKKVLEPSEILLVVDGMSGQDAVNVATEFKARLEFTGVIMTKLDGDARGGAALSIKEVTGRPIKFSSQGEGADQFDRFHPDRIASRILGKGDVVTLVEKAQEAIDAETAADLEKKLREERYTLNDFLTQLRQIRKLGPISSLMGLLPGAARAFKGGVPAVDEASLKRTEAIISSMTVEERQEPGLINGSRRRRIAAGSGNSVQQVNQLLKQFQTLEKMIKMVGKGSRLKKGMPFPLKI